MSGADLPRLVTDAMNAIEQEFEPLAGALPRDYGIFETKVLEDLTRLFNGEQIKQATGDVFGRIYEYFLAKFSIQKAHHSGEFFTPSSIGVRPGVRIGKHVRAVEPLYRAERRRYGDEGGLTGKRRTATPSVSPR